jgi:hypothetical protein
MRVAAGKGPAAVVTHSSTALISTVNQAAELRLYSNPQQFYVLVVILAAQKPQTGTSEHELKESANHIASSALPLGGT